MKIVLVIMSLLIIRPCVEFKIDGLKNLTKNVNRNHVPEDAFRILVS